MCEGEEEKRRRGADLLAGPQINCKNMPSLAGLLGEKEGGEVGLGEPYVGQQGLA